MVRSNNATPSKRASITVLGVSAIGVPRAQAVHHYLRISRHRRTYSIAHEGASLPLYISAVKGPRLVRQGV
eukprot:6892712-Pyramimonas_sp.AAC.1